jgi:hypothetical protein
MSVDRHHVRSHYLHTVRLVPEQVKLVAV